MTISDDKAALVRQRANFACEFCGVTELDTCGQLTIDHFQPRSVGGSDDATNLLYCCYRCNLYKADYWPAKDGEAQLWNPRQDDSGPWVTLGNGVLHGASAQGEFTIARLRLNRPQLVAYR